MLEVGKRDLWKKSVNYCHESKFRFAAITNLGLLVLLLMLSSAVSACADVSAAIGNYAAAPHEAATELAKEERRFEGGKKVAEAEAREQSGGEGSASCRRLIAELFRYYIRY